MNGDLQDATFEKINLSSKKGLEFTKGKFTLEILSEIINGNIHYGSLLRSVEGINPRILAQRLHDFEQEGILSRKVLPTSPPQVEYKMTKKGIALEVSLKKWKNGSKLIEIRLNLHNLLLIFFYKIENVILKDLVILLIKAT